MDYASFVSNISFRVLEPDAKRGSDRRFTFARSSGENARLVELPYAPIDFFNTRLPARDGELKDTLRPLCDGRRMSTFGVAAYINEAVARMPAGAAYVNIGVWMGFSLLSGMVGNPGKPCVGVDNFSEFGGPRDAFMARFARHKSTSHHFHEMDYREYFSNCHRDRPIGVYYYDGDHSYENQLLGLQIAEPHFTDGCIVFVDDTNWPEPHSATYDFIAQSERPYRVLLDRTTAGPAHPTFWNGLVVIEALPRTGGPANEHPRAKVANSSERPPPERLPSYGLVEVESDPPLVSLVLHNERPDPARLEAAVEGALTQMWPAVEVILIDESESSECREVVAAYDGRVSSLPDGTQSDASAIERAIEMSRGEYIAFADCETPLRPTAVEVGLAYPAMAQFSGWRSPAEYQLLERTLRLTEEIASVIPPGQTYALAGGRLKLPDLTDSRQRLPFFQHSDETVTRPPDAIAAIEAVEEHRRGETGFVAFAWPAFKWLNEYGELRNHLSSTAHIVLEGECVVVFDVRR